ncbi:ATP-dependent endonuclease [Paenibacillus sp. 2TAB23]|uniref:ATP-dependent nuclease n=1 Tax=Paenibacillus sp. 2TAB23 TaxID=3233004 RepID=UPI003F9E03BC
MKAAINFTKVEFKNYKALRDYTISIQHMNILVGPNNSGKSTILSAFRALGVGVRHALSKKATIVKGLDNKEIFGYQLNIESLPMSLENVHTDYEEVDTTVRFTLSNSNQIVLFFPFEGGCYLLPETQGKYVVTPSQFRTEFPISLEIVPVLGPIEQNEHIVSDETIRKGLTTHRASRHFRNYWRNNPSDFKDFAELVSKTWPGMEIESPKQPDIMLPELIMFCRENRISRELFWSGFGFQIWCQLLTHISRCKKATLLIVDEPEVYLHPDVQRQLLGILRYCGPDIILATHSTEIMGESDPSEILLINKKVKKAERIKDIKGIQRALDSVGSVQNITLTHLARTGRLLFVEGDYDYKILRRFARQLGLLELASGNEITAFESGGFSSWDRIKSFAWGFKSTLDTSLRIGSIYDRDFWSSEQLESIKKELDEHLEFSHIHSRKELENYLLVPEILEKTLKRAMKEKARRSDYTPVESDSIYHILDRITKPLKNKIQAQYVNKRVEYLKKSGIDGATIGEETLELFDSKWSDVNTRMEIVPGKEVLALLRTEVQIIYSVTLTDFKIIDEFNPSDFSDDLRDLLFKLDAFRSVF